ncbi:MAG: 50S ribosomal protein L9 [Bacteroidales bacterium]|nr:50S ribosomal protein L9 [Bacteroidales bacterium]MBR4215597.1 50S ribosomal protein L9 [Bacteroidales bacterium]
MEIILKQDYNQLGSKGDIVTVKDGYGNNFLIPKGIATVATESAKKILAENKKQQAHKEEKLRNEALAKVAQIEGKEIKIGAKTSTTGKIFGSVNTIQIAEALAKNGIEVDRKTITIADEANIKEIGKYKATIKLYKDVKANIEFEVVSE